MSASSGASSRTTLTVAARSLTRRRPPSRCEPSRGRVSVRLTISSPSKGMSASESSRATGPYASEPDSSNVASTSAASAPGRIISASAREPSAKVSAWINTLLPAPVSPVITVNPGCRSSSTRSASAKSRRCRPVSNANLLMPTMRDVLVGAHVHLIGIAGVCG